MRIWTALFRHSKISDLPTGWICGQVARDFVKTKTGMRDSINIQEAEEFKTSKFYCKTDFDMDEIAKEEAGYVPLPKFYSFPSREARERVLYSNFLRVIKILKTDQRDSAIPRKKIIGCKSLSTM